MPVRRWVLITGICLAGLGALEARQLPPSDPLLIASSGLTALVSTPFNASVNPAAGSEGIALSTAYPFAMPQLKMFGLANQVCVGRFGFFSGWQMLDEETYREHDFRVGSCWSYPPVSLGLAYGLRYEDIAGYGAEKEDGVWGGLRVERRRWRADLSARHFLQGGDEVGGEGDRVNLALGYRTGEFCLLSAGVEAEKDWPAAFKFGCNCAVNDILSLLVSWDSRQGRFGVGGMVRCRALSLAYAMQTHHELDWTHAVGLGYILP